MKNKNIRYFEVEFAKGTPDDYYSNGVSICIKAIHEPSCEEATEFTKEDLKIYECDFVSNVRELTKEEAFDMFDMERDDLPIFGL